MAPAIQIIPIVDLPEVRDGEDLGALIRRGAAAAGFRLQAADVVVIAQKIVSKAQGRSVALAQVTPSPRAEELARTCQKDPRLVELVLRESERVVRCTRDVLIVQHRLGFIVANAGIDQSNVSGGDGHALLLPADPDGTAAALHDVLSAQAGGPVGVIINDSFGRPWRLGTCGTAIGCAGVTSLSDLRGMPDRFGRPLQTTTVGTADEIAAAASLAMGQAAEGIPIVLVRGLPAFTAPRPASALIRPQAENLFD